MRRNDVSDGGSGSVDDDDADNVDGDGDAGAVVELAHWTALGQKASFGASSIMKAHVSTPWAPRPMT